LVEINRLSSCFINEAFVFKSSISLRAIQNALPTSLS
jgi:hypothetical protein